MIVKAGGMPKEIPPMVLRNSINQGAFFANPTGLRNDNWELYSLYVHILKWGWTVEEYNFNDGGDAFVTLKSPDENGSVIMVLGAT